VTYGVGIARKGGVTPEHVLNTRDLQDIQDWLAQQRRTRLHA
jgi:histidinol phosphatase-like PHP family hydrolase